MRLFLIRHGQTDWSLSGQHTGITDVALNAAGEAGARALEPWLRDLDFSHVFTSPRQRAHRTCELAGLGAAARIEPDLAEWDHGEGAAGLEYLSRRMSRRRVAGANLRASR